MSWIFRKSGSTDYLFPISGNRCIDRLHRVQTNQREESNGQIKGIIGRARRNKARRRDSKQHCKIKPVRRKRRIDHVY